jgi:hypothetical protein
MAALGTCKSSETALKVLFNTAHTQAKFKNNYLFVDCIKRGFCPHLFKDILFKISKCRRVRSRFTQSMPCLKSPAWCHFWGTFGQEQLETNSSR